MSSRCWCGGEIGLTNESEICLESELHDPIADGRPAEIKVLYIAGPMSGYEDANYPEFNRVEEILLGFGYATVNPTKIHSRERVHYVDLLRTDLIAMLECDGVATLDNWWESVGARNEIQVAGVLKMPVRSWKEWVTEVVPPLSHGTYTTTKEA